MKKRAKCVPIPEIARLPLELAQAGFVLFAPTARWQTGFQAPAGLTLFISARGFARPFLARAANSKRLQGADKAECAALFRSCIHSKMSWWRLRKAAFSPH